MMVEIERASGRVMSFVMYGLAAVLGVALAFLNIHSGSKSRQIIGDNVAGGTAYADAPGGSGPGDGDAGTGTVGSCGGDGCGSDGTGGSGTGGGTGGGTGAE